MPGLSGRFRSGRKRKIQIKLSKEEHHLDPIEEKKDDHNDEIEDVDKSPSTEKQSSHSNGELADKISKIRISQKKAKDDCISPMMKIKPKNKNGASKSLDRIKNSSERS